MGPHYGTFNTLKQTLATAAVLAQPNYHLSFDLDVAKKALTASVYLFQQIQEDQSITLHIIWLHLLN